jgi:RNA polymerase-binding transcription factor DksA
MTARNGQTHRDNLLALRARLLGEMSQMADAALKDVNAVRMPSDMADVGTDAFEQELTLDLLGNEKEVLEQIEAALGRIEDGSYGRCEGCGRIIPRPAWTRSPIRPYASSVPRSRKTGIQFASRGSR